MHHVLVARAPATHAQLSTTLCDNVDACHAGDAHSLRDNWIASIQKKQRPLLAGRGNLTVGHLTSFYSQEATAFSHRKGQGKKGRTRRAPASFARASNAAGGSQEPGRSQMCHAGPGVPVAGPAKQRKMSALGPQVETGRAILLCGLMGCCMCVLGHHTVPSVSQPRHNVSRV